MDGFSSIPEGAGILLLYSNQRAIVMGKHQNPWTEVCWKSLGVQDPPLFRRITGGGTVYHDEGNLNFSFIQPRAVFEKAKNLELIKRALSSLGVNVDRTERGDLFYQNRKVSGNALCYRKDRVLHHGTLLIHSDTNLLKQVLTPPPGVRNFFRSPAVGSVSSPTINLQDAFPSLTLQMVVEQILQEAIERWSSIRPIQDPYSTLFVEKFNEIVRRHGIVEWVWESTPPFWYSIPKGRGKVRVEKCRIVEVMGINPAEDYIGRVFDPIHL